MSVRVVASAPRPAVLVVYATTDGHTATIAAAIAETLRGAAMRVDVMNAQFRNFTPRLDDYQVVIVAASVHAGSYQREIRQWVRAHAAALATKRTAFISVCLSVLQRADTVDAKIKEILETFYASTGWTPTETKVVAGALLYRRYGWFKRRMMQKIVAKAGGDTDTSRDYYYTDWSDLAEFTEGFAERAGLVPAKAISCCDPAPPFQSVTDRRASAPTR